jgi:hypothetical protein
VGIVTAETWRQQAKLESRPEDRDYCLRYAEYIEQNFPEGYDDATGMRVNGGAVPRTAVAALKARLGWSALVGK